MENGRSNSARSSSDCGPTSVQKMDASVPSDLPLKSAGWIIRHSQPVRWLVLLAAPNGNAIATELIAARNQRRLLGQ